jgi:hypothetical protein
MATTTRVVLTCDLHGDGTDAVDTVTISNGAARYELDLCQAHLDELTGPARRIRRRAKRKSVVAVRRKPAKRAPRKRPAARATRARKQLDTKAIREWTRADGHSIGDRGRIPAAIVEAFTAKK